MSCKQEREERKGRQRVMGQQRCNQCEDHKNDCDAGEEIIIELVSAVAGTGVPGLFLSPQLPDQPRQLDRPGKETYKDCYKIEWQEQQVHPKRARPVTFHRRKRTTNDMSPDSNCQELAVSLNQRGNSPERYDREHQQHSTQQFEMPSQLPISNDDNCRSNSEQR